MKRVFVLVALCVLQSICYSQGREEGASQLSLSLIGLMGEGSEFDFEFEEEALAFSLEVTRFLNKQFSLGIEANYAVFTEEGENESPQGELNEDLEFTALPLMLSLKSYLWNAGLQPYLKLSGGALLGWFEDEREDTSEPDGSEFTRFDAGVVGGAFAGMEWRFFKGLGLQLQGGVLFRHIASRGTRTATAQAGLLLRF